MKQVSFSDHTGTLSRHDDIASQHTSRRIVDVWTPPEVAAGTRLPVIYMHDGQNLFDPALSHAGVDWGIDEAMLRVMIATGLPGALVVGIWNTEQRRRDYAPQAPLETLDGTPAWGRAGGASRRTAAIRWLSALPGGGA